MTANLTSTQLLNSRLIAQTDTTESAGNTCSDLQGRGACVMGVRAATAASRRGYLCRYAQITRRLISLYCHTVQ